MNYKTIVSTLVLVSAFCCGAATEIFVDCTRPDDSGDGLTRATAKRTIQAAVDATASGTSSARNLITVYPGDYDEGGVQTDGLFSRVSFNGKKYITLQAAPDAETMPRIIGRHDPDTENGLGANAIRCIYCSSSTSYITIKNLMLCDGATYSSAGDKHEGYGGAVCFPATTVGCVITNCIGYRGGAIYKGTAHRTLFVNCKNALREVKAINCVFRDGTGYCLDYGGALVNCTVIGHEGHVINANKPIGPMINCLVFDNISTRSTLFTYGYPTNCVTDLDIGKYAWTNGTKNVKCANPAFGGTHPDGLCPLATETKVVGAADVGLYDSYLGTSTYGDIDFYGNPRKTNGKMNIGAVEATVPGPYKTIHVDPNGDDANSGFGPDRPKRTLLVACRTAVEMGTNKWTVLAAPGRYAEGSDYTGTNAVLRSRCFVSNNVSLVSRDGKDVTFIVGASTNKNECGDGCAIRGAYMNYHKDADDIRQCATIKGFTFADAVIPNSSSLKWRGGAIYANSDTYCYVEDCFFTNCSSYSAAVQGASLRRCSAVGCDYLGNACVQHDCFYDLSKNNKPRQAKAFYNCTFLGTGKIVDQAYNPLYNCVFSGGCYVSGTTVSNCLYDSSSALNNHSCTNIGSRVIKDLMLNADGTPKKGSPVIDAAVEKNVSYTLDFNGGQRTYNGQTDIGAFEYDWRPDYAAYLHRKGCFAVTNATKTVTLDAANLPFGVKLGSGGTLAGVWTARSALADRVSGVVRYKVTGNGSLKVYQDGALVQTLTKTDGDGWATLELESAAPSMDLAFTYTAGTSDPGTAYLGKFSDGLGTVMFIR